MDAQRRGALRQKVYVARRVDGELGESRIALDQLLLPDLEFRQPRAFAHEIDAEVELPRAGIARQHVVHRGDDVARLQVAAAEPEASGEEVGHLLAANGKNPRIRER